MASCLWLQAPTHMDVDIRPYMDDNACIPRISRGEVLVKNGIASSMPRSPQTYRTSLELPREALATQSSHSENVHELE
ncbi:hypothetical protein AVEN_80319-1 [Araneus ventricosus]|uniref:Uncharacterized protein n=1 Tax=Araneus ventricosus TaxID=182803 RepID=A0A4Y2KBC0_ARAVE|nr:hypothetical protein AVEN_43143-1 [Araneus ventricosus]GBM98612.1 hypothetical protein AVEN_80319-1 [Araneus ventricosus]